MALPPKKTPEPREKSAAPLPPAPEPQTVWALGLVPTKRLGNVEFSVVAYEITGDRCTPHLLPDGNYPRLEDALADLRQTATQGFRFKKWPQLVNGRAG